jgi:hypothetical protein
MERGPIEGKDQDEPDQVCTAGERSPVSIEVLRGSVYERALRMSGEGSILTGQREAGRRERKKPKRRRSLSFLSSFRTGT